MSRLAFDRGLTGPGDARQGAGMVRRRSPSHLVPLPDPLPEGWAAHDGGPLAVAPDAMPAVWFRGGQRMQAGLRTAASWEGWAGRSTGSCWTWEGDAFDIVALRLPPGS